MTADVSPPGHLKAFVIGPIGDRDADAGSPARSAYEDGIEVLENIIVPACSSLGLEAFRADQISRAGEIPEQVFRHLRDSHIVIADLTDANPNVMYELGLRHTTGKLTIQIGERNRLPFDVSTVRTILFKRTEAGLIEARRSLVKALAVGLESGGDPVTATRVWFEQPDSLPDLVEVNDEADVEDEPGFLEQLSDAEDGIHAIAQTLSAGVSIMEEITSIFSDGTEKINSLPVSGNYSANKLAIANRIAARLEDPALRLKIIAEDFKKHVDRASPGMIYMLTAAIESPEQLKEAPDFVDSIQGLVRAADASVHTSMDYAATVAETGRATRSMRRVTRTIAASAELIAGTSKRITEWQAYLDRIAQPA